MDEPTQHTTNASTPKWIGALVATAVIAAGAGWLVGDRSTPKSLGEPVALEESVDAAMASDAADEAADAASTPSWLFSLTAAGGTFSANALNPNVGTLTLTGPSAETTGFTDRPVRDAVTFATDRLPAAWPEMFADSDPNAVLVTRDADGTRHSYVLELTTPTIDGTALTFQVAAIEGKDHSSQLPGMTTRAATPPPGTFGEVTLFIDSVSTPGAQWMCLAGGDHPNVMASPAPIPATSSSKATQEFELECYAAGGAPAIVGQTS